MVKGISKQVILVHNPDPALFEQAIYILKEGAVTQGITDDQLLKEAKRHIRTVGKPAQGNIVAMGPLWAVAGAALTGLIWLITACVF